MKLFTRSMGVLMPAAAAVFVLAGVADAQLGKVDQKCRDSIAKAMTKAVTTADKVSAVCHKSRNAGKIPATTDCNDLSTGQADSKSKFDKAKTKLSDTIQKKCIDAGAGDAVLDLFISCPEPCATETGVPNPMTSFSEVAQCLACVAGDIIETRNANILGAPSNLSNAEQKCHSAIAKGYGKRLKTLLKERTKCQKDEDKAGNNALQPCDTSDNKQKIAGATTKAEEGLDKSCAGVNLAALDSCDNTDLASLKACLLAEDDAAGSTAFQAHYKLDPTVCPVSMTVRTKAGTGKQGTTQTRLDAGWNGIGHGQDLVDLYTFALGVDCVATEPPCGVCTLTGIVDDGGQYQAFTRCREDPSIGCGAPFTIDPACPGLQECVFFLGPPLPLSASNTPVCVLNRVETDISGTTDIEAGSSQATVELRSVVHTGITLTQPCPRCAGDTTAQDGNRDGTCVGGPRDGQPCDVQGFDATFGDTSTDCPPATGQNISGQGLRIDLALTTGASSLPFGTQCDFPLTALNCACAVCSGDTSIPCNDDATCASASAGTCSSNGGGAARAPNGCSDLTCTDLGGGFGKCMNGPDVKFCDGQTRANGKGFISCATNADCDAVDPACDGGDCGACTITESRSCFLDPVTAAGAAHPDTPLLGTVFCVPPTSSSGVNNATGLPGPSRAVVQLEVEHNY